MTTTKKTVEEIVQEFEELYVGENRQYKLGVDEETGKEIILWLSTTLLAERPNKMLGEIEAFEKEFKCIAIGCDNKGTIPQRVGEEEWEPEQCEYCYTVRFPLIEKYKQFLIRFTRSVIEQAMPEERGTKNYNNSHEAIMNGDKDYGFNTCRTQFQENVERILKDNKK